MKFRRFSAAVLAAAILTSAVPSFTASAESTQKKQVVVLGDATAAGTGLSDIDRSCGEQLAGYLNADVTVFANETYTTEDVLALLEQTEVQAKLAQADMILVSAGMYDIMTPYITCAKSYLASFGLEKFSQLYHATQDSLGLTDTDLLTISADLSTKPRQNKNAAVANIKTIAENLSQYQNAQVIYLNVYHPLNILENFEDMTLKRQNAYEVGALNPVMAALCDPDNVNPTYNALPDSYPCTVIDTFTLFGDKAYLYCVPSELDIRMNATGHTLVALQTAKQLGIFTYGNLDGDEEITASDAAVLLVHSASCGAGSTGTLNALQETAADVTGDGEIDAADAAAILAYAAAVGSGETPPPLRAEG